MVDDARNHSHVLRQLQQFNYYEGTIDRGQGVREKSKQLMEILREDSNIRDERKKARALREKFSGRNSTASSSQTSGGGGGGDGGYDSWNYNNTMTSSRKNNDTNTTGDNYG